MKRVEILVSVRDLIGYNIISTQFASTKETNSVESERLF